MAGWPTVQQVVSEAALELGLSTTLDFGDPYSSSDPNIVLLLGLLNKVGTELVRAHQWSHLEQECAFLTSEYVQAYPLPIDFFDMIDQTGWNRTSRLPTSPVSAQQWAYLKGRLTGIVFNVLFRQMQGMLYLYPDTQAVPPNFEIAFKYTSSFWVQRQDAIQERQPSTEYKRGDLVSVTSSGVSRVYRCVVPGTTSMYQYGHISLAVAGDVTGMLWEWAYAQEGNFFEVSQGTALAQVSSWSYEAPSTVIQIDPPLISPGQYSTGDVVMHKMTGGGPPGTEVGQFTLSVTVDNDGLPLATKASGPIKDGTSYWNLVGFQYDSRLGTTLTVGTTDSIATGADVLLFDKSLLVAALKVAWLKDKGFDSEAARDDLKNVLEATKGADGSAPRLSMGGGSGIGFDPLMGSQNIPVTGFGG